MKYVNELYADVFAYTYGFESIGLRYCNVFGLRQNRDGAYTAVIPDVTPMRNGFRDGDVRHSLVGDGLSLATDGTIGNWPMSTSPTPAH